MLDPGLESVAREIRLYGIILLAAGAAISLARWGWRRFRPASDTHRRTYAELIPLLAGTRAFLDGALVLWEVPSAVLDVWHVVAHLVVLGALILFVRMCIIWTKQPQQQFRPVAAATGQAVAWPTHAAPEPTIESRSVAGQGGSTTTISTSEPGPVTLAGMAERAYEKGGTPNGGGEAGVPDRG
ncbi:hypothetical protein [Actinacidiphila glaucinigra]|uniref:hypothetical protein n=1 Tax=Actinacidiphila glaucinigra TaxID=235986 RepID=UPI0035E321E2